MIRPNIWRAAAALALLTGACGQDDPGDTASELPADELYNRIEAARELKASEETAPVRLGALSWTDLPEAFRDRPSCRFTQGERVLLLATAAGGVARIDGRPTPLRIAGPVDPTGGYFEAGEVTVSVGRQTAPLARGAEPAALATASIGNRRDATVHQIEGLWQCAPYVARKRTEAPAARFGAGT